MDLHNCFKHWLVLPLGRRWRIARMAGFNPFLIRRNVFVERVDNDNRNVDSRKDASTDAIDSSSQASDAVKEYGKTDSTCATKASEAGTSNTGEGRSGSVDSINKVVNAEFYKGVNPEYFNSDSAIRIRSSEGGSGGARSRTEGVFKPQACSIGGPICPTCKRPRQVNLAIGIVFAHLLFGTMHFVKKNFITCHSFGSQIHRKLFWKPHFLKNFSITWHSFENRSQKLF